MNIKSVTWLSVFILVLAWSAFNPFDRTTWWLEVIPAIIGLIVLAITRRRFPTDKSAVCTDTGFTRSS